MWTSYLSRAQDKNGGPQFRSSAGPGHHHGQDHDTIMVDGDVRQIHFDPNWRGPAGAYWQTLIMRRSEAVRERLPMRIATARTGRAIRRLPGRQQARTGRIDGATFCCNFHRGVVGGVEGCAGGTNFRLRDVDRAVIVAARGGTINLLLTSGNSIVSSRGRSCAFKFSRGASRVGVCLTRCNEP